MRKLIVIAGSVLMLGAGVAQAQDMSLGGTGAAIGGGSTLDGGSNGSMSNAMGRARGAGGGGSGMDGGGDDFGGRSMGGSDGGSGGSDGGRSGAGAMGSNSATAPAAAAPKREPMLYGGETGESLLSELLRGGARRAAPRARRASLPSTRNAPLSKYNLPPRGYLASYLPADRYKVASSIWRYVAIEDDAAQYPARYYYAPSAANFLQIISKTALGARIRGNRSARVIGFHTWQDALMAGYRPDPVSKPAPGAQLAQLASSGRSSQLARYLSFVYAGQVPVSTFDSTYSYAFAVQRIANSRRDTKRYAGQAVGSVLLAALGEGPRPIQIGPYGVIMARPPVVQSGALSAGGGRPGDSSSPNSLSVPSESANSIGLGVGTSSPNMQMSRSR